MGSPSPVRTPLCTPVSAAPSDEDPAPEHLPPTIRATHAHAPIAAPSESLRAASRVPESCRDDPFAELSPGPSSATPLLHPQLQHELIEQAAGMSTCQVASLLAAAAPEVVPSRDTLPAVAPDRYTLKVSIDQECEQGLRLLKDLMSHVDPRMSWGGLVARLVREGVARHDPCGGGSGQRRQGSAGASTRRAPHRTRAAEAPAGPAQGGNQSSPRAPDPTRAAAAPVVPARRGGDDTPASPGDTAAAGRRNPISILANAAPPRRSAPAARSDDAPEGGAPTAALAAATTPQSAPTALSDGADADAAEPVSRVATSAPKPVPGVYSDGGLNGASDGAAGSATADGCQAAAGEAVSPVATPAPKPAPGVYSDGRVPGASAEAAARASADGSAVGAGMPVSPLVSPAPKPATGVSPDGARAASQPGRRRTQPAILSTAATNPRRGATFLRLFGATSGNGDGGRCCYRDLLSGRRCTSSHLLQIDHLLPVVQGGGPNLFNLHLRCFAHHSLRHGHGSAVPPERPM